MPHDFGRTDARACAGTTDRRLLAARPILALVVGLSYSALVGCGGLSVREPRLRNAIADRAERLKATNQLSSATGAVLLRYSLLETAASDPGEAAHMLEKHVETGTGARLSALALAELSYQAGLVERAHSETRSDWYRDAAVLATLALEEPTGSRPDLAVRIHNGAVSRLICGFEGRRQPAWPQLAEGPGGRRNYADRDDAFPQSVRDRKPARRR